MSSREDLEFLFEAVSQLLHMEARGGAGELRAAKFDKRWESYRESRDQRWPELAKELARLRKRVAELERAAGVPWCEISATAIPPSARPAARRRPPRVRPRAAES